MASSFDNLSDSELRKKLLEIGYDLPVSINREFLVKKLKSVYEDSGKNGSRRKSVGRSYGIEKELPKPAPMTPENNVLPVPTKGRQSPARGRSRLSLNEAGSTSSPRVNNSGRRVSHMNDSSPGRTARNNTSVNYKSFSSMTTVGDESDSDFDMTAPSPPANLSKGGPDSLGSSWSSRSDPKVLSRFSSPLLSKTPTPLTATPPSNFSTPVGEYVPRTSTFSSTPFQNGNWKNHITTSVTPVTSRYPAGRRGETASAFSKFTGMNLGSSSGPGNSEGGIHVVSSILVGVAVLFFACLAVLYLNLSSGGKVPGLARTGVDPAVSRIGADKNPPAYSSFFGFFNSPKQVTTFTSNYPICGEPDVDTVACIRADHLKTARVMFTVLKDELTQRAKWSTCAFSGEKDVSLDSAKRKLYQLGNQKKLEVDDCFRDMLILVVENPNWGLTIISDDGSTPVVNSKDLFRIDYSKATILASNVQPAMMCIALGYVQVAFKYLAIFGLGATVLYGAYLSVKWYRRKKQEDENELFAYVDQVLEALQARHEMAKENDADSFIAVNHIRDALVPAKDRLKKKALWDKVVDYISNHESRVREEIQHIAGEEYRVWRWLPTASPVSHASRVSMRGSPNTSYNMTPPGTPSGDYLSSNSARPPVGTPLPGAGTSKWQGQAFELSDNSPNALPISPTNCLKIRHMFDFEAQDGERQKRIQNSIIEKCSNAKVLHIGVDKNSTEGCVYVRCATNEDAKNAFMSLHGWWYDGHLLSVKFLREERYLHRFPEAKHFKTPLIRQ